MPQQAGEGLSKKDENLNNSLANESGLAIVFVDENSSELSISNNNSMCEALYSSAEFAPQCAKFCGKAFEMAEKNQEAVHYECHAGLSCLAVPMRKGGKQLVSIVGRAFLKAENYRKATERAISGDWKKFPPTRFFENVLLTGSVDNLERLAKRLEKLNEPEANHASAIRAGHSTNSIADKKSAKPENPSLETKSASGKSEDTAQINKAPSTKAESTKDERISRGDREEVRAWRSFFGSLLNLDYRRASADVLKFLAKRYGISSLAWLENRNGLLETGTALGGFKKQPFQIGLPADDPRLITAFRRETALELQGKHAAKPAGNVEKALLFPVVIGSEVRFALVAGEEVDEPRKKHIARFCQSIASEFEILRLREEVTRGSWLERAFRRINQSLENIDTEDFWTNIVQIAAELMQAERGSLLVFDEKSGNLTVKAAVGRRADAIKNEKNVVGKRICKKVLQSGAPLIVSNIESIGVAPAPADWQFRTKSFISYPIIVGGRKIGVLNVADKVDGESYAESDLHLLKSVMPQLAVAVDRTTLKYKAGEYEQLSVTDALTGLLNRRYLEERLTEETKRSNRYGYPMSFMMIDVDNFKSYNDTFGHPEGDKTLQIVAHALRDTLRGADVAARYGGEEFSILLPQTAPDEARTIAERIRQKIELTKFPHRAVTISVGIASCTNDVCTPEKVISAADKALYEAKRKGRNNVQIYEEAGARKPQAN